VVSWIKKEKGWLKGYVKEKQHTDIPKIISQEIVVKHIILECPYCHSDKLKCYGRDLPVKYYRCNACKKRFKVKVERPINV